MCIRDSPLLGGVLADAQHLPHGRCQAGDRHSNSTRPGTTSLRPGKTKSVEDKYVLLVPSSRDEPVIAQWSATATNADGQANGSFEIPFAGQTVSLRTKREAADENDD